MSIEIPPKEALTVEFKSDRDRLSDKELVEADEPFLQLVVDQENQQSGGILPIDSLIALAALRE